MLFLFKKKKKSKAINELNKQLEYIHIIKHYIKTLLEDDHEFELEITRNPPVKVVWILSGNRLKYFEFSIFPEKNTYLYSKN